MLTCPACAARTAETDRFCVNCGAALQALPAPREARKKVSVLFVDVVGSTQLAERLDPEPLREVMDQYFAACSASITDHGGVVEKFIGDAVMAAFGALVAHEDDAVRAVRAAVAALAAVRRLSAEFTARYGITLDARCGVCTGDVVVLTTADGDFRVVGDAGNTASRLQNAAPPGGILLDADTASMIRHQVGIEPVAPLRLKGKASPVPAFRVAETVAVDDERTAPAPFIGREDELLDLRQSYRRMIRDRQLCLVTVLGVPGIGKSRLVQEFLGTLPDGEVLVLAGRCSPYGRGITYKPLADILAAFPGGWPALAGLLGADGLAARTLATVTGAATATVGTADIAWAARSLLDTLGQGRPVVMVWEDLHWAEETLLDLVDDVASRLTDVPVLMLCVARGELLETRPTWGGGKTSAMTLELVPMTRAQSVELVAHLALREEVYAHEYTDTLDRVAAQCDGNPLFAELIMDVVTEADPDVRTPPTIHALLGARLDQLPGQERTVVELAAIIGRDFTGEVLHAMAAEAGISEPAAADLVAMLVRRRVLARGRSGTIRFAQPLLRETAYEFTPKTRRQRWHEFVARWYGESGDGMAVAYHVEQAWALSKDLRPGDATLPGLASAAADALTAEGMRALDRKDLPAAVQLLERARELVASGDARHTTLALHVCDAGLWLRDAPRCLAALAHAEAALPDDRRNRTVCAIQRCLVSLRLGLVPPVRVAAEAAAIRADLERHPGDDLSWCRFHSLQAHLHLVEERTAAADAELRLALDRARAMADGHEADWLLSAICELAQWTPTPVEAGLALCESLADQFAANRMLLLPVLVTWTTLLALAGDLPAARTRLAMLEESVDEIHLDLPMAAALKVGGDLEALAGRHDRAEGRYRRALEILRNGADAPDTQNVEVLIARSLFEQGRLDDAAEALDRAGAGREVSSTRARIAATALRGRIASATGRHPAAIDAATAARALGDGTDDPRLAGATTFDLAVVLRAAGRAGDAERAGSAALRDFEAKGAVLFAERTRAWLAAGAGTEARDG